jgi:hypothetical protein
MGWKGPADWFRNGSDDPYQALGVPPTKFTDIFPCRRLQVAGWWKLTWNSGCASRKVLEAEFALSSEDRAKPMSVSHDSVANTLAHIYFGDAIWFARIADPGYPVPPMMRSRRSISQWPRLQAKWEAWAKAVTESNLDRQVPFNYALSGTPIFLRGRSWCTW